MIHTFGFLSFLDGRLCFIFDGFLDGSFPLRVVLLNFGGILLHIYLRTSFIFFHQNFLLYFGKGNFGGKKFNFQFVQLKPHVFYYNRPFAKKIFIFFLENTIKNKLKSKISEFQGHQLILNSVLKLQRELFMGVKTFENKRKEAFYGGYAEFQILI